MADIVKLNTMLDPVIVKDIFSKVKGRSSLAKLSAQEPIPFNGNDYFVFSMDDEAALVGESEAKERGSAALNKVTMRPVKLEYGARFSDEFLHGTNEAQLDVLTQFATGSAVKFARALDIMGFHGMNPRTGTVSALLGDNYFDKAAETSGNIVTYTAADPESNLEDAVAMLGDADNTGFAFSKEFGAALAKIKVNGVKQYPEFALGANPAALGGVPCDVNTTLTFGSSKDRAIVGDFQRAFKWGYAKELPLEVIQYGDPDNSKRDLKGHNEVYLRTEAYIGYAILDGSAFALIQEA